MGYAEGPVDESPFHESFAPMGASEITRALRSSLHIAAKTLTVLGSAETIFIASEQRVYGDRSAIWAYLSSRSEQLNRCLFMVALLAGAPAVAQTATELHGGGALAAGGVAEISLQNDTSAATEVLKQQLRAIPLPLTLSGKAEAVEVSTDRLILVSPKGSDLYSPANGAATITAPRVTFTPKGDFIFSARVARPEGGKYEGGALVIFAGTDRWAKILFERLDGATHAISSSVAAPLSDNSYHQRLAVSVPAVWLKIVRVGGSVMLYASEDGERWQILRDFPLRADIPVQVGFVSQSPQGERYAAKFNNVRFQAKSLKDYWQGK